MCNFIIYAFNLWYLYPIYIDLFFILVKARSLIIALILIPLYYFPFSSSKGFEVRFPKAFYLQFTKRTKERRILKENETVYYIFKYYGHE